MKARKIGPGVYAVGTLGEIEMEQWVIDDRVAHGLPAPKKARHLTTGSTVTAAPVELAATNLIEAQPQVNPDR